MQNKDQFFIKLAEHISSASYCNKLKVGAVLVKDGNIISFGYNGTPIGFDNTCELNGITKQEVLHAESNAITKCAKSTYSSEGATLYLTHSPCLECSKLIIQAGIIRIVYKHEYRLLDGVNLLNKSKVNVFKL
jgi:dCMP deaminase